MCRVAAAEFDPLLSSAALARRWVAERLERWELPQLLVEAATLLTSELVANAIVHTSSRPAVLVAMADGLLEVGVSDREPALPRRPADRILGEVTVDQQALMAEGGRGLLLVDALADEWGATSLTEGKQVWFRLSATDWPYRSACRCHRDHIDRVRLESGRYALAIAGPWDHPA